MQLSLLVNRTKMVDNAVKQITALKMVDAWFVNYLHLNGGKAHLEIAQIGFPNTIPLDREDSY